MNEALKKSFDEALLSCEKGPGMKQLIEYMEVNGFYDAPCSGGHHLAKDGGLLEHSMNVMRTAIHLGLQMLPGEEFDELKNSIIVCSLLHDLGKMGQFGKPNYIPNVLKSGEVSKAKPYLTNPDLLYIPHEVRSISIIPRYIDLTEDEYHAIYYHNGKYTHIGYDMKETTLSMLIHFADIWCSRYVEGGADE